MDLDLYFQRFGFAERQIATPPLPKLGLIVVVPAFDEPDLIGALQSLAACELPESPVEVIVVLNAPDGADGEILRRNRASLQQAADWAARRERDPRLTFHLLNLENLPARHAGVGLARKIGMDEALRRFHEAGTAHDGVIACFDADCRCDSNYLSALEDFFGTNRQTPTCSIYFEHPLTGSLAPEIYEAITLYELHLRYYVQALRWAGFPFAFHTVGSAMAVRAEVYAAQGGMNRCKAGEDFYFLNKLFPLGGHRDLNATRIVPSPRPSHRVPFGTGKAVRKFLETQAARTYPLEAFQDLKSLFHLLPAISRQEMNPSEAFAALPAPLQSFIGGDPFEETVNDLFRHTSSPTSFQKRFFRWFDGFRVMKFVHHARDRFYGEGGLPAEPSRLARILAAHPLAPVSTTARDLLEIFRRLDRASIETPPPRRLATQTIS